MKAYERVEVQIHVFFTSALIGGGWSASLSDRFISEERATRYPLGRRLGGPQNQSRRHGEEDIIEPTGTRSPLLQPVDSRHTDCAIPAPFSMERYLINSRCNFVLYLDIGIRLEERRNITNVGVPRPRFEPDTSRI
jgi:hypothetical protein